MFKLIIVGFLMLLNLEASTDEALKAFKNKDYATAFRLYEKSAIEGDAKAQSALSYLFSNGLGTKQDSTKAMFWLEKAAKGANSNTQ